MFAQSFAREQRNDLRIIDRWNYRWQLRSPNSLNHFGSASAFVNGSSIQVESISDVSFSNFISPGVWHSRSLRSLCQHRIIARMSFPFSPADPTSSTSAGPSSRQDRSGGPHESTSGVGDPEANKGKSGSKGKARAEGKTKIKEKKVHKCTFSNCEKVFITPAQ